MRHVTSAGWDNDLYWTHTTAAAAEANFGQWNLRFLAAGSYYVDVYQDDSYSESLQANYRVHHNGIDDSVVIDQTAAGNWLRLGAYDFAAGDAQFVHLGDNTGEASATNTQPDGRLFGERWLNAVVVGCLVPRGPRDRCSSASQSACTSDSSSRVNAMFLTFATRGA